MLSLDARVVPAEGTLASGARPIKLAVTLVGSTRGGLDTTLCRVASGPTA